jgi:hypothetical protein
LGTGSSRWGTPYEHVIVKRTGLNGYVRQSALRSFMKPKINWGQAIAQGLQATGEAMMPPEQAAVWHDCDTHGGVATIGSYDETSRVTVATDQGSANGTATTTKYYAVCKDGTRFHN